MGEPNTGNQYCYKMQRTQCELKYLSNIGGEIKKEIPLVVTSEKGKVQTNYM